MSGDKNVVSPDAVTPGRGASASVPKSEERFALGVIKNRWIAGGALMVLVAFVLGMLGQLPVVTAAWRDGVLDGLETLIDRDYYGVAGVIAAILIAAAVTTNYGQKAHSLPPHIRRTISVVTGLGAMLLVSLAGAGIILAVYRPDRIVGTAVNVLVALILFVFSSTITGIEPPQRALDGVRKTAEARRSRARRYGIEENDDLPGRRWIVMVWVIPFAVWMIFVIGVMATEAAAPGVESRSLIVLAASMLGMYIVGPCILQFGWQGTADLSDASSLWLRWFIGIGAFCFSISTGYVLMSGFGLGPVGCVYMAYSVLLVLVFCIPTFAKWSRFIRYAETRATLRSLQGLRDMEDAAEMRLKESEDADQVTGATPAAGLTSTGC